MEQNSGGNPSRSPFFYLGLLMTLVYLCFGALLLFNDSVFPNFPSEWRSVFGAMVIMFGLYRGWRVYDRYVHGM